MSLPAALLLSASCYALLTFFLLPSLRVAWKSEKRPQKILRAGILSGFEVLSRFGLIAMLTVLAIIVAIYGFTLISPPTVSSTQRFLAAADTLSHALSIFKNIWTQLMFLLAFSISAFTFYRMSKNRLQHAFEKALAKEVDRLQKARSLGGESWQFLPPTVEMSQLTQMAEQVRQEVRHREVGSRERGILEDALIKIAQKREELDFARRINIEIDLDETSTSANRYIRFWRTMSSAGFASDLKGVGAFFRTAASVMLVLCLTSVCSGPASKVLADRKLELKDLRITRHLEEAEKTRSNLPTDPMTTTPSVESPAESAGLKALAQEFEAALKNDPTWNAVLVAPRDTQQTAPMRADWVRVYVRARDLPQEAPETRKSELFPKSQWGQEADSAFEYATTRNVKEPSPIQKSFIADWKKDNLQQIKDMSKKLRELGTLHRNDYQKPRTWSELHDWALGELIGAVLEGVLPETKNAISSQVEKASSKSLEEAIKTYYQLRFNQFVVAFANRGIDEARNVLASGISGDQVFPDELLPALGDAAHPESNSDLSAKLRGVLDQLNIAVPEADRWKQSAESARLIAATSPEILKDLGFPNLDVLADSFVQYSSDFPASKNEPRLSATLKKSWGLQEEDSKLADLIASSKDFRKQQTNPDTGGILIGRAAGGVGDLRGFDWRSEGGLIKFTFIGGSGNHYAIGPYAATLVYQALLYATDDRPVAVMEIYDAVTGRRKLSLHPVFADSPFGSDLIRIDQWIFDSLKGGDDSRTTQIENAAIQQILLYNDLANHADTDRWRLRFTLKDRQPFETLPESISPLTTSDLFDKAVAKQIFQCARSEGSSPCTVAGYRKPKPVEVTGVVSQIREAEYTISSDLSFLSDTDSQHMSLFDLKILIPLDRRAEWDIATHPQLVPKVFTYVAKTRQTNYLNELNQFTVLQRLFRAGFHGSLGESFPVERIAELADVLSPFKPQRCNTPRWEAQPVNGAAPFERRFASLLSKSIDFASHSTHSNTLSPDPSLPAPLLLTHMRECQKTIQNSKGPLSDATWEAACSFASFPSFSIYSNLELSNYDAHAKDSYQFSDLVATVNRLRSLGALLLQEGGTTSSCDLSKAPARNRR